MYANFTDHRYERFTSMATGLPEIPLLELRDASEADVGRIKGDVLRLGEPNDRARMTLIAAARRASFLKQRSTPKSHDPCVFRTGSAAFRCATLTG